MLTKLLVCAMFTFYFNGVALCYPIPNLFGSFNVIKIETPFRVGFEIETSRGSQNIIKSLTSASHRNRFDVIPRATDKSNIARNDILILKPKNWENVTATTSTFKGKTIPAGNYTTDPPFNDDNSITEVNAEADLTSKTNTEFTTDFTTTEDYETTTMEYEEAILNRAGVSPEVVASLLG